MSNVRNQRIGRFTYDRNIRTIIKSDPRQLAKVTVHLPDVLGEVAMRGVDTVRLPGYIIVASDGSTRDQEGAFDVTRKFCIGFSQKRSKRPRLDESIVCVNI